MTARRALFDDPGPLLREVVSARLDGPDSQAAAAALVSAALHDPEWSWVPEQCVRLAGHDEPNIRRLTGVCLGHLARIHGVVNREQAMVTLKMMQADPDHSVRAALSDVLDDLDTFLGWKPFLPPAPSPAGPSRR